MVYSNVRLDEARFDDLGKFLTRELHQVVDNLVEVQYGEIVYDKVLPVVQELDPGMATWSYKYYDRTGYFDFVADGATDMPSADVFRGEISGVIRTAATEVNYTVHSVMAAEAAKKNGSGYTEIADKMKSAYRAYQEFCDRTALFGKSAYSMPGLLNNSNVEKFVPSAWITAATAADDDIAILNEAVRYMVSSTNMLEKPDTVLVPYSVFYALSSKARSSTSDTTVLKYWLSNNPYIKNVEPINYLTTANSLGNLSADRMVFYRRDPEKIKFHIPQPFQAMDPVREKLNYNVVTHARVAGVELRYPRSVLYVDAA